MPRSTAALHLKERAQSGPEIFHKYLNGFNGFRPDQPKMKVIAAKT
jgi:hypothetical protein